MALNRIFLASLLLFVASSACTGSTKKTQAAAKQPAKTQAPKAEAPKAEAPKAEAPKTEAPDKRDKKESLRIRPKTGVKSSIAPPNATVEESGLAWKIPKEGHGTRRPGPKDTLLLKTTVNAVNGEQIYTTGDTPQEVTLSSPRLLTGLVQGIQYMVEGESRKLWLPAHLTFTDHKDQIFPDSDLVVTIDLIKIKSP